MGTQVSANHTGTGGLVSCMELLVGLQGSPVAGRVRVPSARVSGGVLRPRPDTDPHAVHDARQ